MSQPLIIGAVGLAVIDTSITDLRSTTNKSPAIKVVVGGFIVMVGLLALSDYKEDIADGLAILILLTTLIGPKGGSIGEVITKLTTKPYVPPATTGKPIVQLPGYVDPNAVYNKANV